MTLQEMSKTKTTAQIVRYFRIRGELDVLISQLDTLPPGEAMAFESCLAGRLKQDDGLICYDKNEQQDIANEMCGI